MLFSFLVAFKLVLSFSPPIHLAHGKKTNPVTLATRSMSLVDKDHQHKENKAMSFLRKIGKVGGAANKSFINAIGVDEGSVGKSSVVQGDSLSQPMRKSKDAYKECTISGVIDDITEAFPFTSSGTQWYGITDRVMGGLSNGTLKRETVEGRLANVLTGGVSLANNGGFIQMATDLSISPAISLTVDASSFDGIEIDVLYDGEKPQQSFNIHLRNPACLRQFSSYRATFQINVKKSWVTIRLPFTSFIGYGPGASELPLNTTALRRIGIVAIGEEMKVYLAVGGLRFYKEK